ncbi:MAG: hypothetical protein H6525_03090 [Actinobacteria bacterium]|nr:hypothetical protein [Actinomycetota bacterium]MCB9411821.1 hypothetical protein [Actinomycetota bacterium]
MAHNPAPRPALRKAPDAGVHPAAPVVAPGSPPPVVEPPEPTPITRAVPPSRTPRPAHLRPVVGLGGSTSDAIRPAPEKGEKKASKSAKGLSAKQRKKLEKKARKRHQRRVSLQVEVPKEVRTKLRKNAKARGTSVDDVVTAVLEGWLE